ncbi:hypothetical protein [Serratia fonticola]|uniref:hypothetical protein n=1 Tax=Serratia fonticola TaxID=47917 RepID=UPI003AF39E34
MNTDIELLVNAINGLKSNGNIIKDYILPISISFISAFLGVSVAKMTFRHQEKLKLEISKVGIINKYIIRMGEARATLIAIKYNYKELSETHFIGRTLNIPYIMCLENEMPNNASELSFMVTLSKDYVPCDYNASWANPLRVSMAINNYNQAFVILKKRNELFIDLNNKISDYRKKNGIPQHSAITLDLIDSLIGRQELVALCDLTEKMISLIDDILFELDDFMVNFPGEARDKLNQKLIKGYGVVLQYQESPFKIWRTLEPDYKIIANLMDVSEDEAKARYDNGYKR